MVKKKIKNIVIIGSNSFSAGSMINYLLSKGFKVFGLSRSKLNKNSFLRFNNKNKNFKFLSYDINHHQNKIIKLIKLKKPSFIFNYACQSMVDESWEYPMDWFYTNSFNVTKLYDAISKLKFKTKLIHISTPEVYGSTAGKITEKYGYNPNSPYAVSRVTPELYLKILFKRKKIDYCSIRASNVYGEYQRIYRIIPRTIFSILKRKKITLDGKGRPRRNFIHIDDVSKASYSIMLKGKPGEIYHICGSKFISIKDLVKKICKEMQYDFNKLVKYSTKKPGRDKSYILSNAKIKKQFNWRDEITIDQGINRSIKWIKTNLNSFSKLDQNYQHKK